MRSASDQVLEFPVPASVPDDASGAGDVFAGVFAAEWGSNERCRTSRQARAFGGERLGNPTGRPDIDPQPREGQAVADRPLVTAGSLLSAAANFVPLAGRQSRFGEAISFAPKQFKWS